MRTTLPALLVLGVVAAGCSALPGAGPTPGATVVAGECDGATRDAVADIVAGQLGAFAAGDWAGALTFASEGFRSSFTAARFQQVIESEFPVVAAYASHELGPCLVGDDGQARVLVVVTDDRGRTLPLTYLLEREDGAWRIAGAVPLDAPDDDQGPLV